MALHYLNPEREPRKCDFYAQGRVGLDVCEGGSLRDDSGRTSGKCPKCSGTGRLGVEGKEPDVEVVKRELTGEWFYFFSNTAVREWSQKYHGGPFPTETTALEAARAAHNGEK